jgi:hypothetical protein
MSLSDRFLPNSHRKLRLTSAVASPSSRNRCENLVRVAFLDGRRHGTALGARTLLFQKFLQKRATRNTEIYSLFLPRSAFHKQLIVHRSGKLRTRLRGLYFVTY